MRKRKHERFREGSHVLLPEAMSFVRACGSGERGRVVRGLREAAAGYSRAVFRVACRKTGLHRERLKQRGYDQSVLLAKEVSKLTGIPCRTDILEKTKHNRTQHNLSAKEREANVRGAYRAEGAARLRILLLDDIVTTGATAVECAKVLYRNGADYVGCVSCATVD